jgi:hypothetical protein
VAELEAARRSRRAQELDLEQLVERGDRVRLGQLGDGRRQVEVEGVARDRRGAQQLERARCEPGQLGVDRRGHHAGERTLPRQGARLLRAGQLAQVERIAAALPVQRPAQARVEPARQQRVGVALPQRSEHQLQDGPLAGRRRQRRDEAPRRPLRPVSEHHRHRRPRAAADQVGHQLEGGLVGPVQVVEGEQQRPLRRQQLEQAADGVVQQVALRRERDVGRLGRSREGGQHGPQLGHARRAELLEGGLRGAGGQCVEGVDRQGEGNVLLELGGAPGRDEHVELGRPPARLAQQRRLADPRLAHHREAGRAAADRLLEGVVEGAQLGVPSDDGLPTPLEACLLRRVHPLQSYAAGPDAGFEAFRRAAPRHFAASPCPGSASLDPERASPVRRKGPDRLRRSHAMRPPGPAGNPARRAESQLRRSFARPGEWTKNRSEPARMALIAGPDPLTLKASFPFPLRLPAGPSGNNLESPQFHRRPSAAARRS